MNNNASINLVSRAHHYKPTFVPPPLYTNKSPIGSVSLENPD